MTKIAEQYIQGIYNESQIERLTKINADLLAALESAELLCTQTRLANDIGKKTKAEQIRFLLASFDQLSKEARAAIAKAKGQQ